MGVDRVLRSHTRAAVSRIVSALSPRQTRSQRRKEVDQPSESGDTSAEAVEPARSTSKRSRRAAPSVPPHENTANPETAEESPFENGSSAPDNLVCPANTTEEADPGDQIPSPHVTLLDPCSADSHGWLAKENDAYAQAELYLATAKQRGILSPSPTYPSDSCLGTASNVGSVGDPDMELHIDVEKTSSRWDRMTREKQLRDVVWGTEKHARKNVAKAQLAQNTYFFDFNLEEAVHGKRGNPKRIPQPEGPWILFDAECPQRAVTSDGYDAVYRFPQAFRGKTLTDLESAMLDWGAAAPLQTNGKNDFADSYKEEYTLSGRSRIALLWHAIGHRNSTPVVCADIRKTGESFEAAMDLLERLEIVNAYCMRTLLCIDPLQYGLLRKVYNYRLSNYASQRAFAALDKKMLWEGREVMFNRWSPLHWDKQDPPMAWACITYVGDFEGAYFEFPQLKLRLLLRPGDVIFFRGHDLLHGVPEWISGQRHFLVHFTHQALWDEAGIPCASSKAQKPTESRS